MPSDFTARAVDSGRLAVKGNYQDSTNLNTQSQEHWQDREYAILKKDVVLHSALIHQNKLKTIQQISDPLSLKSGMSVAR